MVFTANIRAYCELHDMTVKDFEVKTGTANGSVKKWETGIQTPTLRTMNRIADKTSISLTTWLKEGAFDAKLSRLHRRTDVPKEAQSA